MFGAQLMPGDSATIKVWGDSGLLGWQESAWVQALPGCQVFTLFRVLHTGCLGLGKEWWN